MQDKRGNAEGVFVRRKDAMMRILCAVRVYRATCTVVYLHEEVLHHSVKSNYFAIQFVIVKGYTWNFSSQRMK